MKTRLQITTEAVSEHRISIYSFLHSIHVFSVYIIQCSHVDHILISMFLHTGCVFTLTDSVNFQCIEQN
jgi:hypothetical protein